MAGTGQRFVVARLLKEWGWEVEVFLYGDEAKLPPDAAVNCKWWREMGELPHISNMSRYHSVGSAIIVDAVFGTGLKRPLPDVCSTILRDAIINLDEPMRPKIVSIDVPSSQCSDSGRILKAPDDHRLFVGSDLSVTFHSLKIGHELSDGPQQEAHSGSGQGWSRWHARPLPSLRTHRNSTQS